jgi:thiol-disulfide isomerase/thioredoxin/outer membrane lipoprotein-sorting protein
MRRQTLVLVILLACMACSSAPGQAGLSAQQILAKTAENYRGVTGYAFQGSIATHMLVQGQVQDIANSLVVAYGGPGRSHFEAATPSDRMVVVNARDSTFTYSSAFAQYAVQARAVLPSASNGLPSLDPNASHPLAGYARLADHVKTATLVGEDTATVDGRTIPTYVIDVTYDTTVVPPAAATMKPKRVEIDAKNYVVVYDFTSLDRAYPGLEKPVHIEQTARYWSVRWNAPPPDSLFAFAAPAGTPRVDRVGPPEQAEPESQLTGTPAGDFALSDLKGVKRVLSSHKGSVVLLDFWATWCGPCRREMPIIAKLHERYAKKGLVVYGVNCSESQAKAKAFIDKFGYTFPQLLDQDGDVQTRYQITAIPTVFIVDRKGNISAHMVGGRSEEELVAALGRAGFDTSP